MDTIVLNKSKFGQGFWGFFWTQTQIADSDSKVIKQKDLHKLLFCFYTSEGFTLFCLRCIEYTDVFIPIEC